MTPNLNCEKKQSKNHHFPSIKSWGGFRGSKGRGIQGMDFFSNFGSTLKRFSPCFVRHMRLDDRCAARRGTLGEVEIGEVLDAICDADDDLGSSFLRISHPRKSLTGSDWVVVSNIIYIFNFHPIWGRFPF